MKLKGHDLTRKSIQIVPVPQGYDSETGEKLPDIIFRCRKLLSYKEFDSLVKVPEAPHVIKPGNVKEYNFDDPTYQAKMRKFERARYDYLVLKSLEATEELTWETVKMSDPQTWSNWETELEAAGFALQDINRIQDGVLAANSISPALVEEALQNFLRGREAV